MTSTLLFLNNISPTEILLIAIVAFFLFGATRFQEMTKLFAKTLKDFQNQINDTKNSVMKSETDEKPKPTAVSSHSEKMKM
jgi:TatA/E family protein of Tat protein translocase